MRDPRLARLARRGRYADVAAYSTLVAGAVGAAAGWRPAAFLMLAGLVARLGSHVVVGVAGYRWAMSHPWPQVRPLDDDEW